MVDDENGDEAEWDVRGLDASFSESIRALREIQARAEKTMREISRAKGFQDAVRAGYEAISAIAEMKEEYARTKELIENGIQNFEAPQRYDPSAFKASAQTEKLARRHYASALERLYQREESHIEPYINRIYRGGKAYTDGEYMLACFAIISIHDGLLTLICSERGMKMSGDGYYTASDKRDGLKEAYRDMDMKYFDVHEGRIADNLERFWEHRNAIMHGDPVAHFDRNIATVAMLFTAITMNVVEDMLP